MGLATQESQYLSGRAVLNCGDDTATEVDHEVMKLLQNSYEEAKRLLREHRVALDKIAEFLIEKETITGKEFMKIFREVEGVSAETEINRIGKKHEVDTPQVIYLEPVQEESETSSENPEEHKESPDIF